MGKLVDLVGSGIGLARELSVSPQSTSTITTPRHATRDASNRNDARGSVSIRHRDYQEYGGRTDSQEYLAHSQDDLSYDENYRSLHEKSGADTESNQWEPEDSAHTGTSLPPPYSVEEYEESANRVMLPTRQLTSSRSTTVRGWLSCPVIIPQRRPENKERGFTRAYAPALLNCGIDEATFLNFLDSLNKASQASPAFDVINVAAFAAGFAPSAAAQVASVAASIAVKVAKSKQIKRQTNNFLDRTNETLFKPHGLLCLIMTYKPGQKSPTVGVDMPKSGFQANLRRAQTSNEPTQGELELPEAAALVFLGDDPATGGQKVNSMKSLGSFTAEYFDKRSQAKYSTANPNSSLNVGPEPRFNSRYSDPNHAANTGGLISLATGGAVNRKQMRDCRKEERHGGGRLRDRRRDRPSLLGGLRESVIGTAPEGQRRTLVGGARESLKRSMKQDVLYLMIVNNPMMEEVDAAVKQAPSH